MITENLSTLIIHSLTQAQYDRELAAGNIDETAICLTPDENIIYATKDELKQSIGDIEAALDELHNYAQALIEGGSE